MTFLPIVDRELRVAARRKSTHRFRLGTTVIATGLSACFLIVAGFLGGGSRGVGNALFSVLSVYTFVLCSLAGVFLTADCLSEEKREGTLGLLFLTDLRGYDVVLGKFAALSVNAFYGLLAIVPVIGLFLLIGGVTGAEFWRVTLALLNALFVSLTAGVCVSAWSKDSQRAMGAALSLVLLLTVLLPLLEKACSAGGLNRAWLAGAWVSPWIGYASAAESVYWARPERFWGSFAASNVFGWLLLLVASLSLPRTWRSEGATLKSKGWAGRFLENLLSLSRLHRGHEPARGHLGRSTLAGNPRVDFNLSSRLARAAGGTPARRFVESRENTRPRRAHRRLLEINPVLWLLSTGRNSQGLIRALVGLWVGIIAVMIWLAPGEMGWVVGIGLLFGFGLKLIFATHACRFFAEARRTGALELLLATPLTNRQIIAGQWLALKRLFLWPLIVFFASAFAPLPAHWIRLIWQKGEWTGPEAVSQVVGGGFMLFYFVFLAMDFFAIGWVGMWLALSMRKPAYASAMTILFVVILPVAVLPIFFFCFWPFVFVADVLLIVWGWARVTQDLRKQVAEPYQMPTTQGGPKPGPPRIPLPPRSS